MQKMCAQLPNKPGYETEISIYNNIRVWTGYHKENGHFGWVHSSLYWYKLDILDLWQPSAISMEVDSWSFAQIVKIHLRNDANFVGCFTVHALVGSSLPWAFWQSILSSFRQIVTRTEANWPQNVLEIILIALLRYKFATQMKHYDAIGIYEIIKCHWTTNLSGASVLVIAEIEPFILKNTNRWTELASLGLDGHHAKWLNKKAFHKHDGPLRATF